MTSGPTKRNQTGPLPPTREKPEVLLGGGLLPTLRILPSLALSSFFSTPGASSSTELERY